MDGREGGCILPTLGLREPSGVRTQERREVTPHTAGLAQLKFHSRIPCNPLLHAPQTRAEPSGAGTDRRARRLPGERVSGRTAAGAGGVGGGGGAMAGRRVNVNVGVLGHIDSGKTALARALSTTASTAAFDKQPQSRERGITLDLGFSCFLVPLPARMRSAVSAEADPEEPRLQVTLVDCPGHASLVRTVIGGEPDCACAGWAWDARKVDPTHPYKSNVSRYIAIFTHINIYLYLYNLFYLDIFIND